MAHVTASAGWVGVQACLLALCLSGLGAATGRQLSSAYTAAHQLGNVLALPGCLLALLTGLLLSLGTPWGLLRYYWVLVKFVLTTGVAVGEFLLIGHLLSQAAARAAALPPAGPRGQLVAATSAQIGLLLVSMLLAVFKPWGRTGYRPVRARATKGRV